MSFIVAGCYFILFTIVLRKSAFFTSSGISRNMLTVLFGIKLLAALSLHAIYTYYYTNRIDADIFKYFDDALVLLESLKTNPTDFFRLILGIDLDHAHLQVYYDNMSYWSRKFNYGLFVDNRTIIRANAVIMIFSWGNIFVHHVFSAFISMLAYMCIYKVCIQIIPQKRWFLLVSVFLIPSTLFWSSAMLKECIVMLGVGLTIYATHQLSSKAIQYKSILILIAGIILLFSIKIYVVLAILPALVAYSIVQRTHIQKPWKIYISIYTLLIVGVIANHLIQIVPFIETLTFKRNDFIMDAAYYAHARSYIPIGMIEPSLWAYALETPLAIIRCSMLPTIWNFSNILELMPAIENFILLMLCVLSIIFFKKPHQEQKNIVWFSILFSLGLLWLVGVTTPVVGAIVRYKIPILPFLYTIFAVIIDWQKIFQLFRK